VNIIEKYDDRINGVLETFDRIIINGYLTNLCSYKKFMYYLIENDVKLVDFKEFASAQTELLCRHMENYVKERGVALQYLSSGKLSKEDLAKQEYDKGSSRSGLIAAFSAVELCNTITVQPNRETQRLEITSRPTKCKHYYLYYNDEEFGWMYFKIQTWFPYNAQVYMNGREYLSRLLDTHDITYTMYGNSFSYIENMEKAQELA